MATVPSWLEVKEETDLFIDAFARWFSISEADELKAIGLIVMSVSRVDGGCYVAMYKAKALRKVLDDTMRDDYEGF